MKKLLLIICLFSMTAHAEWKFDGDSDIFDSYIDYSRIKTEGRYKSIWTLLDYKLPNTNTSIGKKYKSVVRKQIIDCQGSRIQLVTFYQYSEQMGAGDIVDSVNTQLKDSQWSNPPPNSFNDNYIKIACATNINPKPPVSNTQDIKRQRCINLGLVPNSADFQQCMK